MSTFEVYLKLGWQHLLDFEGYDHMLFLLALCAVYPLERWKSVLILVTAFTVGHSISLAMATLQWVQVDGALIEFLIPTTILLTSLINIVLPSLHQQNRYSKWHYSLAVIFGLIHGLGFSGFLQALLGKEEQIWQQLLAFNIGLELGQLLFVALIFVLLLLAYRLFSLKQKDWNLVLSGATAGISLMMMFERIFW